MVTAEQRQAMRELAGRLSYFGIESEAADGINALLADVEKLLDDLYATEARLQRELEETRCVRNDRFVDRGEYTAVKVERDKLRAKLNAVPVEELKRVRHAAEMDGYINMAVEEWFDDIAQAAQP